MSRAFLAFVCALSLISAAFADEESPLPESRTPNDLLQIAPAGPGFFNVSWYRRLGRAYFLQLSGDLITWSYCPGASDYLADQPGNAAAMVAFPVCVVGPDRFFVRLKSLAFSGTEPLDEDFDSDKVSTRDEITVGTDPFAPVADSDSDGMSDDWEKRFELNPNLHDANVDTDEDGISNLNEYLTGSFGSDPTDYYNGNFPSVAAIGWSESTDLPGTFAPPQLVAELSDGATLLPGLPVVFRTGGPEFGQVSETNDGNGLATTLRLRTGLDGRVRVYFKHPNPGPPNVIETSILALAGGRKWVFGDDENDMTLFEVPELAAGSTSCRTFIRFASLTRRCNSRSILPRARRARGSRSA